MRKVHEYEAWSQPGHLLSDNYGKEVAEYLYERGIPHDAFLGLYNVSDKTDVENMRLSMLEGEINKEDFILFCKAQGLIPDLVDMKSANKFMEYSFGRILGWVHIPDDSNPELLINMTKLLNNININVIDPENHQQVII